MNALNPSDFTEAHDPLPLFLQWLEEATASEPNDPEAMILATVDAEGMPDARAVLCKGADERGLTFYTNAESAKGRQLAANGKACALFHWKTLRRQARFRGTVAEISAQETDAYYSSRPRLSRIGAWASQQSRPLDSRATLEAKVAEYDRQFPGEDIPRPPYWRGYRLTPLEIELWRDGQGRLHDRVRFTRAGAGAPWAQQRLFP